MASITFTPRGVCSRRIDVTVEDGKVGDVQFHGGCDGNLKAISKLVEGRDVDEVIETLAGNTCGPRPTSCADQLAQALAQAKEL